MNSTRRNRRSLLLAGGTGLAIVTARLNGASRAFLEFYVAKDR